MRNDDETKSIGCAFMIGLLSLSAGIGAACGEQWGFIVFGVVLTTVAMCVAICGK